MTRKILTCLLLAGLSRAALADDPAPTPASAATTADAPPTHGRSSCLRETGSHVQPKPGECVPEPGRSYSREDIENTGATDASGALRRLDPSFTR